MCDPTTAPSAPAACQQHTALRGPDPCLPEDARAAGAPPRPGAREPCCAAMRLPPAGSAQVADFGRSHRGALATATVKPGRNGVFAYQAPEVLAHGMLSPAANCYAFGVLPWEMLTAQARPGCPGLCDRVRHAQASSFVWCQAHNPDGLTPSPHC